MPDASRAGWRTATQIAPERVRTREYVVLALITLLAAALRVYRLDTDLWIDEIGSFQYATSVTVAELLRTFSSPNQHLMNSILTRLSVAALGEHDWTIRLPAVVFGIATIPALYWLARPIMKGWQSLAVAFLAAVSYHHIWFSQNARGYSAYLLFCVLATAALWRLLQSPSRWWIALYALSAVLGLTSLIITAFVIVTHVVLTIAWVLQHRRAEPVQPVIRRAGVAFGITAIISLAIYGPTALELLRVVGMAYVREGTGFRPVSLEFVMETLRGLGAGFGSLALVGAVPFLVLVAIGTLRLMRRGWLIVLSFVVPLGMMAALVVVAGWLTSPRFFLLVVPLAFLVAVESLDLVARLLARGVADAGTRSRVHGALAVAAVAVCAVALGFGLGRYYAVPKQSFRAAIAAFTAKARPGDALVAVYQADRAFDFYTRRLGLTGEGRFYSTRTVAGLDSLCAQLSGRRVVLATTFERAFRVESPELWKRVETGWTPIETLPSTVGYGEITLWEPRRSR